MSRLAFPENCLFIFLFSSFIAASGAQFFSLLCVLGVPSKCSLRETWDPQSCSCVPDLTKCPPPHCPLRSYSSRCLVYKKDFKGCQTCECECDELSQICPVNCPNGTEMVTRPNFCKECLCRRNICKPAHCENRCPFGYKRDRNGCETCKCNTKRHTCPTMMCMKMCPYGTFEDTNNCPTCVCKPKPICPLLSCDNFCPSGREVDSNGCDTCTCNQLFPTNRIGCLTLSCPARCRNGYQLDSRGCSTCKCKPNFVWQQITWRQ